MVTVKELKAKQIERTKAYRERMKAKGMKPALVYISEAVLKEAEGSPQKLVDLYINSRGKEQEGLFSGTQTQAVEDTGLRQEVMDLQETVKALSLKVDAMASCPNVTPPEPKKPKVKFDPAWFNEFNERQANEGISQNDFAEEKGIDKGTLSKHFKRLREGGQA
ncbi:MAG: winged helix-turn-helix domain-containing protein [Nitrospirae bacterium]|nr:winged helix-turn-helix domain-containing protein [Nitrospirota bacterium]